MEEYIEEEDKEKNVLLELMELRRKLKIQGFGIILVKGQDVGGPTQMKLAKLINIKELIQSVDKILQDLPELPVRQLAVSSPLSEQASAAQIRADVETVAQQLHGELTFELEELHEEDLIGATELWPQELEQTESESLLMEEGLVGPLKADHRKILERKGLERRLQRLDGELQDYDNNWKLASTSAQRSALLRGIKKKKKKISSMRIKTQIQHDSLTHLFRVTRNDAKTGQKTDWEAEDANERLKEKRTKCDEGFNREKIASKKRLECIDDETNASAGEAKRPKGMNIERVMEEICTTVARNTLKGTHDFDPPSLSK